MTKVEESAHIPLLVRHSLNGVMRFDDFNQLYTEPRIALWELKQRRLETALKESVRQNLDPSAEEILKKFRQPRALFFRNIATPSHETLRFLKLAKRMKLKPLILEYYDDKFVSSENRSKRLFGKMPIYQSTGSDGQDITKYKTVCDFNVSTGKKFKDIICLNGEKLISLHHRLFKAITGINPKTFSVDASHWYKSVGGKPERYYEQAFTLLIRDGILFENFVPFRSEGAFTKTIILPVFEKLKNQYGAAPLIVRLLQGKEEMRLFWDAYPRKIEKYLWI